ncbi:MAG: EAL domain-containing protein [Planctomycetota bacterium]
MSNPNNRNYRESCLTHYFDQRTSRVLIVDDEKLNRAVLKLLLSKHGFESVEVSNGGEAIKALQQNEFDLVLLDIVMPVMNGHDTLRAIRKQWSEAELPVIMVTAVTDSDEMVRCFKLGANDFIPKPIDPDVTIARIRMQMRLKESQEALKKSEERYALMARGTNDGLWDWDLTTNRIYYSPRWTAMLGLESELGRTPEVWFDRVHEEDRARVETDLQNHLDCLLPKFETELRLRHADGSFRWMLCRGLAVWDDQGVPIRVAGSLSDITEGKVADALTGLPNRALFRERLERCVAKNQREPGTSFALLYLDLDNFKLVNDSLGHDAGDRLLVSVARRLENSLRESDSFVSRLGGDEFAVLLEGVHSAENAIIVASRIINSVSAPISLGSGREVFATVSVGISISTEKCEDATEMLQAADTAMYQAKGNGKSCYRIFDPAMKKDATERLNIENELRRAIERKDFHLHYQPIVDMTSAALVGFEALVRWNHEEFGNVSPAKFIPIAEDTGLIVPIGQQILRMACQQMSDWKRTDPRFKELKVNVNLSGRQLCDTDLAGEILQVLAESGLSPNDFKLEVTESSIMQNPEKGAAVLSELRENGVKVAIDDFGTGYSSLAYIHKLSPDVVKIDRSFVDQITTSIDKQTIVGAIIALANGLNLDVVAEGVETQQQRNMLAEMGCEFAQGYLFSRPLDPSQVSEYILENRVSTHPDESESTALMDQSTMAVISADFPSSMVNH